MASSSPSPHKQRAGTELGPRQEPLPCTTCGVPRCESGTVHAAAQPAAAHSGSHPAPQRPPSDLPRAELPPAFLSLVLTHRPPKWAPRLLQEQRQVGTLTSPRCDTWVQWLSKSDLFWVQKVGGAWERQAAGVPCTDCEHPEGRHSLFPVWVPSALYWTASSGMHCRQRVLQKCQDLWSSQEIGIHILLYWACSLFHFSPSPSSHPVNTSLLALSWHEILMWCVPWWV